MEIVKKPFKLFPHDSNPCHFSCCVLSLTSVSSEGALKFMAWLNERNCRILDIVSSAEIMRRRMGNGGVITSDVFRRMGKGVNIIEGSVKNNLEQLR
jgi:hypothetical protein